MNGVFHLSLLWRSLFWSCFLLVALQWQLGPRPRRSAGLAAAVSLPKRPSLSASTGLLVAQNLIVDRRKTHEKATLLAASPGNSTAAPAAALAASKRLPLSWLPKGAKNALASYLATLFVKIAIQPFDTIKTVQQMDARAGSAHLSVLLTAASILKLRGVSGLWAGTWVSAFGAAPSVGVYFGVFSAIKARLAPLLPVSQRTVAVALAAAVGNSVAAVFRVPYEVFKQRLQTGAHRTFAETLRYTLVEEGVWTLFGGGRLASQVLRDVPYAVLTAVLYDFLQRSLQQLRRRTPSTVATQGKGGNEWVDAASGAIAGGVSTLLTTPLDVVKTRLMASTHSEFASVGAAVAGIWRQEGAAGFFRGGASRLLHKVPGNALFFAAYELLRFVLGAVETRSEQ